MNERDVSIKELFKRAAEKYEIPEICDIKYTTNDRGGDVGVYSFCYNKHQPEKEKFCGPDWVFWSWPSASIHSYKETRDKIIEKSKISPVIDKIGWFGNINSPPPDVPEHITRPLLYKIGKKYPDLFDIIHISPQNGQITDKIQNYLSLPDLTKYKYLIDIGGNGWSGRLKLLLFTRRPIFLVDRVYIDYFYKDLIPFVHFIPVKQDLSDLLEKYKWVENNPQKATEIAENAYNFAGENFTDDKLYERIVTVWWNQRSLGEHLSGEKPLKF